jgi:hypothetical protein
MSPTSTPVQENNAAAKDRSLIGPPEEKFWKRYSPHHELPLSSIASISLHVLGIGLLILFGYIASKLFVDADQPLPIGIMEPGGGGEPEGSANSQSEGQVAHGPEIAPTIPKTETPTQPPTESKLPEPTPQTPPALPTPTAETNAERVISENEKAEQHFASEVAKDLFQNNLGGAKKGQGPGEGPGVGGGPGGSGSGKGNMTVSQKRKTRWNLIFKPAGADEHVRQFAALGAILAFPKPGGQFFVIRKPLRPQEGRIEDVHKIPGIFWVDEERHVAETISRHLGVYPPPTYFVAFLPKQLEEEMAKMETQARNRPEEDIGIEEKFNFEVVPDGVGYRVIVSPSQP